MSVCNKSVQNLIPIKIGASGCSADNGEGYYTVQYDATKDPHELVRVRDVFLPGDLTVCNNLTVLGTTSSFQTETVLVEDNMIHLSKGNSGADDIDSGFFVEYGGSSGPKYAGMYRENMDGKFFLFKDLTSPPGTGAVSGATGVDNAADIQVGTLCAIATADAVDKESGAVVVTGGVGIGKQLQVGATATFEQNVQVDGDLNVDGKTTLDELCVDGNITATGDLDLNGELSVSATATFEQNVQVDGDLNVDGKTTLDELCVDGNITATGDLDLNGTACVGGNLKVSGYLDICTDGENLILGPTGIADNGQSNNVVVGCNAGPSPNLLVNNQIAIGENAGQMPNGGMEQIAIGLNAGNTGQNNRAIAIGTEAGQINQGQASVAIGHRAGNTQGNNSVSIGYRAGFSQGLKSVAIGFEAGESQGEGAIAIGHKAGDTTQGDNSIIINASTTTALNNNTLPSGGAGTLLINPIRASDMTGCNDDNLVLQYNNVTSEVVKSKDVYIGGSLDVCATATFNDTVVIDGAGPQLCFEGVASTGPSITGSLDSLGSILVKINGVNYRIPFFAE